MAEGKFDAIVVGAGPAGCACALKLARAGLETLLVERGKFPGAKNMWGGALYGPVLRDLFPGFFEEAPVERYVAHRKLSFLDEKSCLTVDFTSKGLIEPPYHGVTLLRSRFDRWVAGKVEEAGAVVAAGLMAEDLLFDGDRIAGIRAGGDDMPADVVVACDGVNSLLAQKAGLARELGPDDVKLGVKEVIALPRETIEARFGLAGRAGVAWELVGCTAGVPGGGFIYTNLESLSVGIVVQLGALGRRKLKANDLLESFKAHPTIAGLLDGGSAVEYSAHLIPTAGASRVPGLFRDGFLVAGDAASLVLATGLLLEGANFALASGLAAAETIIAAKEKKDFSAASLSAYGRKLEAGFVLGDLETFRHAAEFLENPRIYGAYPEIACALLERLMGAGGEGEPRKKTWAVLREVMRGKVSLWRVLCDMSKARGAL
jgi:electron transfer flavoprotein-quinone oxidoreductase